MNDTQYIVALEICSSKIVGAIAERYPNNAGILVKVIEEEKMVNCVRYGCIKNVETTKSAVNRILSNLQGQVANGQIKEIYVGFAGRSVHNEPIEVSKSMNSDTAITERTLSELLSAARSRKCSPGYEVVDISTGTYCVDNADTLTPIGVFGSNISTQLNQIVAKQALRTNLNRVLGDLGFTTKGYIVTQLALGQYVTKSDERSLGCVLVDLGAETTSVSIYKGGILKYLNTIPIGGRNITRDIMALNVIEEQAESVKKNIESPLDSKAQNITIEGVKSNEARNYIISRTGEIIANINVQLAYAGYKPEDLHNIVITGGASQMRGLPEKLAEVTKLPVRLATMPANIRLAFSSMNKVEYQQLFALLLEASTDMGAADNCVEIINSNGELPFQDDTHEEEPEKPAEPEKPQKPSQKGFLEKLKDLLASTIDESNNNDNYDA